MNPSALESNAELDPAELPAERAGHLLSVVCNFDPKEEMKVAGPSRALTIALPQTTLAEDIFSSPALLQMGFQHDFPTAPALSQPIALRSLTRATRRLTPVGPVDNGGRASGSNVPGWTGRSSERWERGGHPSAAVVQGCAFPCFGAGVLRNVPRGLLVPRVFSFSPRQLITNIEERLRDQTALSHVR